MNKQLKLSEVENFKTYRTKYLEGKRMELYKILRYRISLYNAEVTLIDEELNHLRNEEMKR
jgi:hypothetical protein